MKTNTNTDQNSSYDVANNVVDLYVESLNQTPTKALGAATLKEMAALIDQYVHQETIRASLNEARLAAITWNDSKDTESFANEMNERIAELQASLNTEGDD